MKPPGSHPAGHQVRRKAGRILIPAGRIEAKAPASGGEILEGQALSAARDEKETARHLEAS